MVECIMKTNIDVRDRKRWNWFKMKKNQYQFKSVSDVIFKFGEDYDKYHLEKKILLELLEKYYEYNFFDMEHLTEELKMDLEPAIELINMYVDHTIPLFGSGSYKDIEKTRKKIHRLMIENDILPREFGIAFKLRKYINEIDLEKYQENEKYLSNMGLDNKLMLNILFPEENDKINEVYNETVAFASWFVENKKRFLKNFDCASCDNDKCAMKKPDYIYYKSGINVSLINYYLDEIHSYP